MRVHTRMYLIHLDVFENNIFGVLAVLKAIYFHCEWKRFSQALKMATGEGREGISNKNANKDFVGNTVKHKHMKFSMT